MAKVITNPVNSSSALDYYFELSKKNADYRLQVAREVWESLTTLEKRTLQNTARRLGGNNLRFGAEHTQFLLLLRHAMNGAR